MATIPAHLGSGGAHLTLDQDPNLKTILFEVVDDLTELRTQFIALLAKLDADIAAGGATETNYEATLTPAVLKSIKGS